MLRFSSTTKVIRPNYINKQQVNLLEEELQIIYWKNQDLSPKQKAKGLHFQVLTFLRNFHIFYQLCNSPERGTHDVTLLT